MFSSSSFIKGDIIISLGGGGYVIEDLWTDVVSEFVVKIFVLHFLDLVLLEDFCFFYYYLGDLVFEFFLS